MLFLNIFLTCFGIDNTQNITKPSIEQIKLLTVRERFPEVEGWMQESTPYMYSLLSKNEKELEKEILFFARDEKCWKHDVSDALAHKNGFIPATPQIWNEFDNVSKRKIWDINIFPEYNVGYVQNKPIVELPNLSNYPSELIYDQYDLGSCTANAMAFAIRYLSVHSSKTPDKFYNNPERLDISRLFQYYITRDLEAELHGEDPEKNVCIDSGASMAGAVIAIDKFGACPEQMNEELNTINSADLRGKQKFLGWPYIVDNFSKRPRLECFRFGIDDDFDGLNDGTQFALGTRKNPYARISKDIMYRDLTSKYRNGPTSKGQQDMLTQEIVDGLALGFPFYVGVMLNENLFKKEQRGIIQTPPMNMELNGGHAICVVGYGPYNIKNGDRTNYFKFINSWGPSRGDRGFGYLSQDYISNASAYSVEGFRLWFKTSDRK